MKEKVTNDKLLHAAIKISEEKGLYHITLQEIAHELGIKPPSLYNHIHGIEDLYLKLGKYSLEVLTESLFTASLGLAGRDALMTIAQAYYRFSIEYPVLVDAIKNPFIVSNTSMNIEKEKIVVLLSKILEHYGYDEEQNIHIIRVMRSFLYGFSKLQVDSLHQIKIDLEKSFLLGINAIFDGFGLV